MPVEPIEAPFFPIIYVRGFAMRQRDVMDTVATPFMGFNDGAAKLRQRPSGPVTPFVFESPLVRLMKEFRYRDVYHDGEQLARLRVQPRSIIIYRYYDDEDPDLVKDVSTLTRAKRRILGDVFGDLRKMERWARNLARLIYEVRAKICGDDQERVAAFRVHLVAHSMGGLICRYLLQNSDTATRDVNGLIDKVFTYATPHGGVELLKPNMASAYFRPALMKSYLSLQGNQVNSLEGKFPVERFFCLVGTNARDYDAFYGRSRWAAGPMSDGLVSIKNAYVEGAPQAHVHRSHSGPFGIVNSEEGYQNLWRFLFGDVHIEGRLVITQLPPSPLDESLADCAYFYECTVAPKGTFGYKLTRRRREDWSAIRRTSAEVFFRPIPVLFSLFVARPDKGAERATFAVDLAISESVAEQDGVPLLTEYVPDQYLFRRAMTLTVGSAAAGLTYSFDSQSYQTQLGGAANRLSIALTDAPERGGAETYAVPLPTANGLQASLMITVRRGDRDPFVRELVLTGRDDDGAAGAE